VTPVLWSLLRFESDSAPVPSRVPPRSAFPRLSDFCRPGYSEPQQFPSRRITNRRGPPTEIFWAFRRVAILLRKTLAWNMAAEQAVSQCILLPLPSRVRKRATDSQCRSGNLGGVASVTLEGNRPLPASPSLYRQRSISECTIGEDPARPLLLLTRQRVVRSPESP